MTRFPLLSLGLTLALLAAAGCSADFLRARPPASARTAQEVGALKGRMEVPTALRLLATSTDVAAYAAVVLRDGAGASLASGTTDADGAFTLVDARPGVALADGQVYILEAVKRIDGTLLTLRTLLLRDGGAWHSPTGGSVVLNLATTALAKLYERNTATLTVDDLLNKVAGGNVTADVGPFTVAEINGVQTSMTTALLDGFNPSGRLGKDQTLVITSQADLDKITAYEEATLIYAVGWPGLTEVKLPNLKRCGLLLIAGAPDLQRVELPALERADYLAFGTAPVTTLSFPRLARFGSIELSSLTRLTSFSIPSTAVQGAYAPEVVSLAGGQVTRLSLYDCPLLSSVSLPAAAVPETLYLSQCPALRSLGSEPFARTRYKQIQIMSPGGLEDLSILGPATQADELTIWSAPNLQALSLPNLASTGQLSLYDLPLTELVLPALATARSVSLQGFPQLARLELPELVGTTEQVSVSTCPSLPGLSLPKLQSASRLEAVSCPQLATLEATALTTLSEPNPTDYIYQASLYLGDLPALGALHMPALTSVDNFYFSNVPLLCQAEPWAWLAGARNLAGYTPSTCP